MCLTHSLCQAENARGALAFWEQGHTLVAMSYRDFLRDFGAAVRARRIAAGKTQPELADAIEGLDQGGLSRVERGKQGFDSDTLYRIAEALDVPAHALFGGVAPSTTVPVLTPEALEVATQWMRLTPSGRLRFRAAMILAMEPATKERLEERGFVPMRHPKRPKARR